jgi:AcrR family transcriptional regulator
MAEGVAVVDEKPAPVRRLRRAQRREQILTAATEAFARNGFAATSLDDIAGQAGITRVLLYRHFDSKTDLYQAVLDRMCARLEAHVEEPVGGFTDASVDGLLAAAVESPAGFRLLFQHALREPEFSERIEKFRADITAAAYRQISTMVPDKALAPWAA